MQVEREQSEPAANEILDGIQIDIAAHRARKASAEAEEAEHRVANRDRIERAETDTAEQQARNAQHRNCRRWIWLAVLIIVTVAPTTCGSSTAPSSIFPSTTVSPADRYPVGVAGGAENIADGPHHLSSSGVQRTVELAMLKRLGKDEGVVFEKTTIPYRDAWMEVDGVDSARTIFVEAFARMGALKPGQEKKVATDTLKFVFLKAENPGARFVLAFAGPAASDSVVGWVRAVLEEHGIERVVVPISKALKKKLLATQADQKTGMGTGTG